MKYIIGLIICFSMVGHRAAAQTKEDNHAQRKENDVAAFTEISEFVRDGNYLFTADRTIPTGGTSISLVTNSNQIRFHEGKADIYLPYFGVVYAGAGYNHEGGIKFTGQVDEYQVTSEDDKRRLVVTFEVRNGFEVHNFRISVNKRGYTSVFVRSSGRSSITYDGYIKTSGDNFK